MTHPLILALDIGTSSVRAALYDESGNVLPETMVKNERILSTTNDGGSEIDADAAFEQIADAIDGVLAKSSALKSEITHAAASAFWHSLVGVDAKGDPTTDVFGWADTRSRVQIAVLRRKFDEDEIHNRTGARFHSSFWPAKLLWLRKEFRDAFRRTTRWLSFSDLIAMRLFGVPATSVSMASATGIFDQRKIGWDAELLKFLKLRPGNLPELAADSAAFKLLPKFARRWPRLKNTSWFPAIGDGAANNIGAGCLKRSKAALMIGTSGAMRVAYNGDPPDRLPSGLWCYRIDRKRVILGGALSDGGGLYRWLKDNLRLELSDDDIEAEIARRPTAGHGLTFMPFLAGERSTGYHENAAGAILGLRSSTDAIDIVQAALESVAYRFAEIFDQLNKVSRIREIVASGGALRESPVWTQIIADVLGRDLSVPDTREASSRGSVLLALEITGKTKNIQEISTAKARMLAFSKTSNSIYKNGRTQHDKYYSSLADAGLADRTADKVFMS